MIMMEMLIQLVVRLFASLTQGGSIEDAARDGPCAHGNGNAIFRPNFEPHGHIRYVGPTMLFTFMVGCAAMLLCHLQVAWGPQAVLM